MSELKIVYVPVIDLFPHYQNGRVSSKTRFEMLRTLYSTKPKKRSNMMITRPIIATRNGMILDGVHVWITACRSGVEKVPVIYVDTDDPLAFMIALNRSI